MQSGDTHSPAIAADCAKELVASELAVTALRRCVHGLNDRLYRALRLRGIRTDAPAPRTQT